MRNPAGQFSVLICFEDMFAQEGRAHVGPDTDFLVNLTDDGWFGRAAEQWQQAASGIFRAVENGVPLLRCTNDGLTCWADAQGRVRQIFKQFRKCLRPRIYHRPNPLARAWATAGKPSITSTGIGSLPSVPSSASDGWPQSREPQKVEITAVRRPARLSKTEPRLSKIEAELQNVFSAERPGHAPCL